MALGAIANQSKGIVLEVFLQEPVSMRLVGDRDGESVTRSFSRGQSSRSHSSQHIFQAFHVMELTKDLLFVACEVNGLHTSNLLLDWPGERSSCTSGDSWSCCKRIGQRSALEALRGKLLPRCSSQRLCESS